MPIYKGKSGVNVKRLVRNIADQYPFEAQEAALIELIANSLDAKATVIDINLNKNKGTLVVTDDGLGMDKEQFLEYHDFAASTKERGKGIGFAGQGAKLALNFCSKITTETQSTSYKGYSEWQLQGNDAPYKIHEGKTLTLNNPGSKVTLYLDDKSKTYYSKGLIEQILVEHYYPLLDEELLKVYTGRVPILIDENRALITYRPIYEKGLEFIVNRKQIIRKPLERVLQKQKEFSVTVATRAKAKGFFGLAKNGIEEDLQGIAICTFGKVIERTWFRKEPREKQRIIGWIEAPYLIEAVTTDKCRFQRGNKTWEGFFRKTQAEFNDWLEEIGFMERPVEKKANFSNLEKEINSILRNIPELTFFGTRAQRDVAIPDKDGEMRSLGEGTQTGKATKGGNNEGEGFPIFPGEEPGEAPTLELGLEAPAKLKPRIIRGGIRIMLDERQDKEEEAWFDGETVTLNTSHPAYKRAEKEKLIDYHIMKSVGLSLIQFSLDKDPEPSYDKAFGLSQRFFRLWGER
jgi:hypothetical protein